MPNVSAIVVREVGKPVEVVRVEPWEVRDPGPGEVLVRMLAAPINPADLNALEGTYPVRPPLPGVPGAEGVGEVIATGPGVEEPAIGARVLIPQGVGTWCEACVAAADSLIEVPADLDVLQTAMLRVNPPTAWRMLHDFVKLSPGDWIIQNAANSGVGRSVIQICRSLGVRSVNVVRRPELIPELEAEGADVVLVDGSDVVETVKARASGAGVRLALNAVGGESALNLANVLARGGIHVTYGAMGRKPIRIPNALLIFKDIAFRGFWVTRWFRESNREQRDEMFAPLVDLVRRSSLKVSVAATYPLSEAKRAIEHASTEARGGKVLFRMT